MCLALPCALWSELDSGPRGDLDSRRSRFVSCNDIQLIFCVSYFALQCLIRKPSWRLKMESLPLFVPSVWQSFVLLYWKWSIRLYYAVQEQHAYGIHRSMDVPNYTKGTLACGYSGFSCIFVITIDCPKLPAKRLHNFRYKRVKIGILLISGEPVSNKQSSSQITNLNTVKNIRRC